MEKLFLLFGDDLKNRSFEFFNSKKKNHFKFLPLDASAYKFVKQEKLPFILIDEWIKDESLIRVREQATEWEDDWYRHFQNSFTSNGICWPIFDKESMYWFWRDYALANFFGEKFRSYGGNEIQLFANSILRPSIYYYWSDIHAAVLKQILRDKIKFVKLSEENSDRTYFTSQICPAITFNVDNDRKNGITASIIEGKIVFALNPGELHRFKPFIIELSKEFPGQIVIISIFPECKKIHQFSKEFSIPIVTPLHSQFVNFDLGMHFLKIFKQGVIETNVQLLKKLASQVSFHFNYYLRFRWPILDHNYLSWTQLLSDYRPKAIITSQLPDSEAQLPAVAAAYLKIPTLSMPHGGFGGRKGEFVTSDYVLFNSFIQKKVLEKSGIPQKQLQPCRGIIDVNEYPTKNYGETAKKELWRLLVITYPISINQLCPAICPGSQIEALKDLNNPPEDISSKIALTIKPHPGWPDLELFSAVSSNLKEKVSPPNQDLIELLKHIDLVIALNCSGTALTHVLRAGIPVIFFWTDPLIKNGVDPYLFADLLLPGGVLVTSSKDLWKTIRSFFTDLEFANNLIIKAKKFAQENLNESNYPGIGEVIKKMLSNKNFEVQEACYKDLCKIKSFSIDEIIPDSVVHPVVQPSCKFDYGEMPNAELDVLCKIIRFKEPKRIFEFGTFIGRTTLHLAANSTAKIYTLDLPPKGHEDYLAPVVDDPELDVYPQQPGIKFQNTPYAERIQQLYGDSQRFDFSPFYGKVDCVFVDANHHYESVLRDSMNAFKMIKPDGVVIWHDYAPYAPGVIRALDMVSQRFPLIHIKGTSLAVYMGKMKDCGEDNFEVPSLTNKEFPKRTYSLINNSNKNEDNITTSLAKKKSLNNTKLMNEKAEQMIKCGNFHEAKQILLKIIKDSADNVDTLTNLAVIECKEGNWQSANEFIKDSLILDPSNKAAKSTFLQIQKKSQFNLKF